MTAYRGLAGWRADGPFGAWLARIATRLAVRRASRRRAVTWIQPGEDTAPARHEPARAGTDPLAAALAGEWAATIRSAVASLDEPYREVVILRFFGEHSLQEIAAATGRPLGTVKTHLHRGLLRLRGALDGSRG